MGRINKVLLLVLDGAGVGALPDAETYGDGGANTIGNMAVAVGGLQLPNLGRLGLGNLTGIQGMPPVEHADGHYCKLGEMSPGKDTPTGHWEMAGLVLDQPFATFTQSGFPAEMLEEFSHETGCGWIGNLAINGEKVIEQLGLEHQKTGKLIVYTSADSVFQIAAHEETFGLERLLDVCEIARELLNKWFVGRVIARPFVGNPGAYTRTYNRKDYTMKPPRGTVLDLLTAAGIPVVGIGKISDIFAGRGVPKSIHTEGNTDGLTKTEVAFRELEDGLVFTNLVDFDMRYGHPRNPQGYAGALKEVDGWLPLLMTAAQDDGAIFITADHGNDPTFKGNDHTRMSPFVVILKEGRKVDYHISE